MKRLSVAWPSLLTMVTLALLPAMLVPGAPAAAAGHDRYSRALERICETGITPEAEAAYRELASALAKEASPFEFSTTTAVGLPTRKRVAIRTTDGPHGKATDFWGPRTPEHAYLNCVQAR